MYNKIRPSYIILRSAHDPEALGPSIADTFNLTLDECYQIYQDKTMPQHMVMYATPRGLRPRYAFAYTILGRAIHNKKYLHSVSLTSPIHSFPFWRLNAEQLIEVKNRLYGELAYEFAQICMEILLEVVEQGYRNSQISEETLQIYSAICTEVPPNRRNSFEEFTKIIQTGLAQCRTSKRDLRAQRDAVILLCVYLAGMTSTEASRMTTRHLLRWILSSKQTSYTLLIPDGRRYFKQVPLGLTASAFMQKWLNSIYGASLFCDASQFPDCQTCAPQLFSKAFARRLGYILYNIPTISEFRENLHSHIYGAYDEGRIGLLTRKILLNYRRFKHDEQIEPKQFQELRTFYRDMEQTLGDWPIPFK